MALTKVTISVTPDEYRTMLEHLTEARSVQDRLRRGDPNDIGQRQARRTAQQEYEKLDRIIKGL